jgi:hypothetical protein
MLKYKHVYVLELYLVIKKNEIMPFVGKWMELQMVLRKIIQSEDKYCIFH